MKVNVITLGCSKNVVDSEHVAGHLRRAGIQVYFDREQTDCDVTIVNTCGFIGDAKEESVNVLLQQAAIKQLGRKPRRLIAVGCLIERYRKELAAEIPEIDAFYGTHQWGELVQLLTQQSVSNFEGARLLSTRPHYAYLKIAEGCNRRCAYCAIPSNRKGTGGGSARVGGRRRERTARYSPGYDVLWTRLGWAKSHSTTHAAVGRAERSRMD